MQEWDADFFHSRSVKDLGLRFQIGHRKGQDCPFVRPVPLNDPFVVLDNNGIHEVDIDFCGCPGGVSEVDQLLNVGWYAATTTNTRTAATLGLLRRFHTLNLQARLPAYDFYNALVLLRNGSGLHPPPVREFICSCLQLTKGRTQNRLPQFMHMVREYRHLQMCKRAGRIHDLAGIAATALGDLAVACRACPQPGINLPEGWQDAPPEIA